MVEEEEELDMEDKESDTDVEVSDNSSRPHSLTISSGKFSIFSVVEVLVRVSAHVDALRPIS